MQDSLSIKKRIFIIGSFYFVFGTMYWLANSLQSNFKFNMWQEAVVDYVLKGLLTVPVWYFIFVILKNKNLDFRLRFHLISCPIYVFVWFYAYRFFAEFFDLFYLKGTGRVWDIYIPTLFYFLQFGFFHAYEYWQNYQQQTFIENELKQAAQIAEINSYKAQLQPHFLFNTLNSINSTLTKDNEPARELIAKLADTFRFAMKINDQQLITLGDEIEFNKTCLSLEQVRFSDRLKIIYSIDNNLLNQLVPPMILQPIIENAVKHGISKSIDGGEIRITIQKIDNKINFEIADTGFGLIDNSENSTGIGLTNTRKRLSIMYDENLTIKPNFPKGVIVTFNIPFEK